MNQIDQSNTLELNHLHLVELLEQAMKEHGEKPAYSCLGQQVTFSDIDRQSAAFAAYLQNHTALKPGDRIAIQLPNLIQFPIVAFGALRAGMVLVNTNPLYTAREMQHQFKDSGAKAIVILADMLPKLAAIIQQTDIGRVIATNAADLLMPQPIPDSELDAIALLDALSMGAGEAFQPSLATSADSMAAIQYTGGTTGLSKGAVLTHHNLLSNVEQVCSRLGQVCDEGKETFITPLPLYHIYAFLLNLWVFSKGNANVLIPNPRDLDGFVSTLKQVKATGFCGINTLFVGLCHHPDIQQVDFSQLKLTISGGAALTTSASEQWQNTTGCQISEGYGLSETSPVVTLNPPGRQQVGSIGLPVLDTLVEIWDDQDKPLANGETGELVVKGPQVMQGYWQQEEETAKVLTKDGWFKTGDVAIKQDDGFFRIVDRKKDMILVSGFNVYPNEVENVLSSHGEIVESAVIGEPCDSTGELVHAYLVKEAGSGISEQDILDYCKEELTPYKVPKKISFLAELPKSTVGKVLRRELRNS